MISMASVKNNILKSQREIKFAFGLLWQFERVLFLLYTIKHLIGLVGSFAMVYFPMLLLNGLSDGDYFLVVIVVLLYSLWQFISDVLKKWIGYCIGVREGSYRDKVSLLIYKKAAHCDMSSSLLRFCRKSTLFRGGAEMRETCKAWWTIHFPFFHL